MYTCIYTIDELVYIIQSYFTEHQQLLLQIGFEQANIILGPDITSKNHFVCELL